MQLQCLHVEHIYQHYIHLSGCEDDGSGSPASSGEDGTVRMGMNRMIPVGGPHIHCLPPQNLGSVIRPQSDSGQCLHLIMFLYVPLL